MQCGFLGLIWKAVQFGGAGRAVKQASQAGQSYFKADLEEYILKVLVGLTQI